MIDLKKRFGALDALEFPHPDKPPTRAERRPTQVIPRYTKGRVPVVIFALLVAAAGIGFAIEAFQTDGGSSEGPPPWDLIAIIESRQGEGPFPETAEVVLVNPVTGESTQITHAAKRGWIVRAAAWSPDGRRLAYVMGDPDQLLAFAGTWNLYVANSDGSGERQLTVDENLGEVEWSPAGDRIVGTFDQGRGVELFDPELGMAGVLAEEQAGPYLSISLSPDGRRLLYQSEVGNGDYSDLFLLDLGSGQRTRLTTGGASYTPAWSPDGSMIAYSLAEEIVVTPAAGGPVRYVTRCRLPDCIGDLRPTWSPDDSQLAFVRQEDGGATFQTYVVDVDGSNLHRLTSGPLDHESPAWRPPLSS
jgi:dipeptidyl aminopeptidase/acylaminoacyl peptidase